MRHLLVQVICAIFFFRSSRWDNLASFCDFSFRIFCVDSVSLEVPFRFKNMRLVHCFTACICFIPTVLVSCAPNNWLLLGKGSHSNTSLYVSPWPSHRYMLPLINHFELHIIEATTYTHRPLPSVPEIQAFIRDFAQNLENAYPPPALSPREAGQWFIDTESFTRWQIKTNLPLFITSKAPISIVLAALAKLTLEVARHGPPASVQGLIVGRKTGSSRPYPYNGIVLTIDPLVKHQLGREAVDGNAISASTS